MCTIVSVKRIAACYCGFIICYGDSPKPSMMVWSRSECVL